ncbi:MAG TPA: DUF192 domain-containing protein [Firmicutes bacterium]|nr:DUF192 domain-containing protein [Bacillota bacterium]
MSRARATYSVYNCTRGVYLAERAAAAETYATRLRGLLGKEELKPGEGLLIRPCSCIHMWGMRFAIDAVYVSRQNRVLACISQLKPWRLGPYVRGADWVLELPAGRLEATHTMGGDLLSVTEERREKREAGREGKGKEAGLKQDR